MKKTKAAIDELVYHLHEMVKKAARDNEDYIKIHKHHARGLLNSLLESEAEIKQMEANQPAK